MHRPNGVEALIDLKHAGMNHIREDKGNWTIGACALLRDIERETRDVARGMLTEAIRETGPWLIRNAATLGGNIANASPAADSVPALLALDARLTLINGEEKITALADILEAPKHTRLGNGLIYEIQLPRASAGRTGAYIKLSRSRSDIAQVSAAVACTVESGGIRDVRIVLGSVAPTALRAENAEALLEGQWPDETLLVQVGRAVQEEVRPVDDWRASGAYRRRISGVLVRRALERALLRAGGQ
ncbi:MAG: hypothetical protein NVS2B16_09400 [Chloroflexota bacterium]